MNKIIYNNKYLQSYCKENNINNKKELVEVKT